MTPPVYQCNESDKAALARLLAAALHVVNAPLDDEARRFARIDELEEIVNEITHAAPAPQHCQTCGEPSHGEPCPHVAAIRVAVVEGED